MADSSEILDNFFTDFAPEERERLLAGRGLWKRVHFDDGVVIFPEGSNSNELYLLLEGRVSIVKDVESKDHKTKLLAVLDSGAMFGEGALLSDKPRSASAVAKGSVDALQLSKSDFDLFVEQNPADAASLLLGLLKVVNQRLQLTNHELVTLYDVARLVSESGDDVDALMCRVAEKLELVTHVPKGLISLVNRSTQREAMVANWGGFELTVDELDAIKSSLGKDDFLEDSGRLVAGIRDLSKNLVGLMILEYSSAWSSEMVKMVVAIAEQVGIAIGEFVFVASERDRSKLQEQRGRVNF